MLVKMLIFSVVKIILRSIFDYLEFELILHEIKVQAIHDYSAPRLLSGAIVRFFAIKFVILLRMWAQKNPKPEKNGQNYQLFFKRMNFSHIFEQNFHEIAF